MMTQELPPGISPAEQYQAPRLDTLMDYAGNNPAKLATIVALNTFEEGEFATKAELVNRLNALQGERLGWDLTSSRDTPIGYCRKSLSTVGLVEVGTKVSVKGVPVEAARLTPSGRTNGILLAGALIPFELAAPKDLLVLKALGAQTQRHPVNDGESSRIAIYRQILNSPQGLATATELQQAASVTIEAIAVILKNLSSAGIVETLRRRSPEERTFFFKEPPADIDITLRRMGEDVRALVETVRKMQERGITKMTGDEILRAAALPAGCDTHKAWTRFTKWSDASSHSFIEELRIRENRRISSQISITEVWQPFIAELLQIRHLLTSEDERAVAFRQAALAQGELLHTQPDMLATVLAKSMAGTTQPIAIGKKQVPQAGTPAPSEGARNVDPQPPEQETYKRFQGAVIGAVSLTLARQKGRKWTDSGTSQETPQQPQRLSFPKNWTDEAACRGKDTDLFFPVGVTGPAIEHAEKAKRICRGCPVRLACLKWSVERNESFGVSGGIWWESPEPELTEADRELLPSIQIEAKAAQR